MWWCGKTIKYAILEYFPATAELAIFATLIAVVFGMLFGILSATMRNSPAVAASCSAPCSDRVSFSRRAPFGTPEAMSRGTARNRVDAYAWMTLAAAEGHMRARRHRTVAWKSLTEAERARAAVLRCEEL